MNLLSIVILILIIGWGLVAFIYMRKNKKSCNGCSGDCSHCSTHKC